METYRNIIEVFAQRVVEKVQDNRIILILDYTRMPVINLDVLFASMPLEGSFSIYFEILFPWIIGKASKNLFEVEFVKKLRKILPHEKDIIITWDRGFAKGEVIKRIINIPGVYFVGRIRKDTAVFINGKKQIVGGMNLEKGKIFSSPLSLRFKPQDSLSFGGLLAEGNEGALVDCNQFKREAFHYP